jgi:hypothetical protein
MDYDDQSENVQPQSDSQSDPEFNLAPTLADRPKSRGRPRGSESKPRAPEPGPNGHQVTSDNGSLAASDDPYNLDNFSLSQDFEESAGVQRLLKTVPVRKPSPEWFVRTHPDDAHWYRTKLLNLKDDREIYAVDRRLLDGLATEPSLAAFWLVTSVNHAGTVFLWPIRLARPDGRINSWHQSMLEAARDARSFWVRVTSNQDLQGYNVDKATKQNRVPQWPDQTFQELFRIAFKNSLIATWDHPVLRRLNGEI